jgi:glycosyltransferase involved in cell wall biosynthesis
MKLATVSFIVPVRNDAQRLERCLRSIQANSFSGTRIEIIVVDNGSTDGSADVARKAGALVLESDGGCVAALRNLGAARSSGEILAFVDADHEITAAWVRAAVETLRERDVAAAGALCHAPIDGTWVQRTYGLLRGLPQGRRDVEWLGSGNLVVRRMVFQAVNGFDTSLTTCEDVDMCNRIRAAGFRIVSNADMKNIHYGDPATLWEVFRGELWRGRDNLRVSLRTRLSWRGMPSVLIPIVDVVMIAAAILGIAVSVAGLTAGLLVTAGAAAVVLAAATLRVARLLFAEHRVRPVRLVQVWVVACVYDLGRALALVTRTPHRSPPVEMVAAR